LDRVVWSIKEGGNFCTIDRAASRHIVRGVDAGIDPANHVGLRDRMGKLARTRHRRHDISEEGEHLCLAFLPLGTQSLVIEHLVLDSLNESNGPPEGRECRIILERGVLRKQNYI
jgi:hypothetical protein